MAAINEATVKEHKDDEEFVPDSLFGTYPTLRWNKKDDGLKFDDE